ncbi:MAG: DUF805 domain-containing protein [Arthrobacter sp.]
MEEILSSSTPNPYGNPGGVTMPTHGEAPLDQPLYGASFGQAIKRFFKKYATFSGRASRSEFWFFALFNAIVYTVFYGLAIGFGLAGSDPVTGEMGAGGAIPSLVIGLYGLAIIIPSIALSVRRLHDGNFSGFLYLLILVPILGGLVVLVLMIMPSVPEGARFDADGGAAAYGNAFGTSAGYPGAPAAGGGFAGQNPPQGYQQPTDPTQG